MPLKLAAFGGVGREPAQGTRTTQYPSKLAHMMPVMFLLGHSGVPVSRIRVSKPSLLSTWWRQLEKQDLTTRHVCVGQHVFCSPGAETLSENPKSPNTHPTVESRTANMIGWREH